MINKIHNSDALELSKKLKDKSVQLVLTDPPYFIEKSTTIKRGETGKFKGKDINFKNDIDDGWDDQWKNKKEYREWLKPLMKEWFRILDDDCHCVIWCDKRDAGFIMDYGEEIGFKVRKPLFFKKSNPAPLLRKTSPMGAIEQSVWLTKGESKQSKFSWQLGMISDVFEFGIPRNEDCEKRHPTQKPLMLGLYLTAFLSRPDEIVFDPFSGSGTFVKSAKLLNRKYIGNDKNKEWSELISKRMDEDEKSQKTLKEFIKRIKSKKLKSVDEIEIDKLLGLGIGLNEFL